MIVFKYLIQIQQPQSYKFKMHHHDLKFKLFFILLIFPYLLHKH